MEVTRTGSGETEPERGVDTAGRDLAVLDGVDHLAAVPQAVAPREQAGDAGRTGVAIDGDPPAVVFQAGQGFDQVEEGLLAEGLDHHVGGEDEVRAGSRPDPAQARARVVELGPDELDPPGDSPLADDAE